MNPKSKGVNEIQGNKTLPRVPRKVHTSLKSSEFTTTEYKLGMCGLACVVKRVHS